MSKTLVEFRIHTRSYSGTVYIDRSSRDCIETSIQDFCSALEVISKGLYYQHVAEDITMLYMTKDEIAQLRELLSK